MQGRNCKEIQTINILYIAGAAAALQYIRELSSLILETQTSTYP